MTWQSRCGARSGINARLECLQEESVEDSEGFHVLDPDEQNDWWPTSSGMCIDRERSPEG